MTYQEDYTLPIEYLEQISEQEKETLPELTRFLANAAMQIERQKHLGAGWHEWSPERRGTVISSSHVSLAAAQLDEVPEAWRQRPLGKFVFLYLDARYEKVRQDAHAGLRAARQAVFGGIPWQRCQFHLQQKSQAYVSRKSMLSEVVDDTRTIFNAPDRATAETWLAQIAKKYEPKASRLADWMETNLPEGLTVFSFPRSHQRRIRTANVLGRLNREIKRRTQVVGIFPNEAACLRLISTFLMEMGDVWVIGRVYLSCEGFEEQASPSS